MNKEQKIKSIVKELHHVALIADGNRRWARSNGLSPTEGHRQGFIKTMPYLSEELFKLGIHTVTLWCFSTGNWKRDNQEVNNLMQYYVTLVKNFLPIAHSMRIKIIHLGRKERIPSLLQKELSVAEKETAHYDQHTFNVAIDYGGKDEIVRGCKKLAKRDINFSNLTEEQFNESLDTAGQPYPEPDLIIRTSPEDLRLSGFMPWQSHYSEFYFTKKFGPALNRDDLIEAILDYGERKRSFSK